MLKAIRKPFQPLCTDPVDAETQHQSTTNSFKLPSLKTNYHCTNQVFQPSQCHQVTEPDHTDEDPMCITAKTHVGRTTSVNKDKSSLFSKWSQSSSDCKRLQESTPDHQPSNCLSLTSTTQKPPNNDQHPSHVISKNTNQQRQSRTDCGTSTVNTASKSNPNSNNIDSDTKYYNVMW